MSTIALVSVEEYLRRTEKPNAEYIDGVVIPKPMPTSLHALMESMFVLLLSRQGALALAELTVPVTATKYLVPDVAVVREIQHPYPTEPAILCIEVLSPEDRIGTTLAKCERYHAWGVPFCWVVDPQKQTACEYHNAAEPVHVESELKAGKLTVSVSELFAGLQPAV